MSEFKMQDGWVIAQVGAKLNGIDPIQHEVTMQLMDSEDTVKVYSPGGYHTSELQNFGIKAQEFLMLTRFENRISVGAN
jgi:hypothetical protein